MNLVPDTGLSLGSLWGRWAARIAGSFGSKPGGLSKILPGSAASFSSLISAAAARNGLPADLVAAVIRAESNFDPTAVSSAGAKGLMQLMDGTAASLGVLDSFNPAQNVEGGARYLRSMLDRYGNVPLALAAYNAGPGAVDHFGGIPPFAETSCYVQRVLSFWNHDWEA